LSTTRYILKTPILSRIKNHKGSARCQVCGEKLKVGDAVVSKPSRVGVRLFHDSCYESLFL